MDQKTETKTQWIEVCEKNPELLQWRKEHGSLVTQGDTVAVIGSSASSTVRSSGHKRPSRKRKKPTGAVKTTGFGSSQLKDPPRPTEANTTSLPSISSNTDRNDLKILASFSGFLYIGTCLAQPSAVGWIDACPHSTIHEGLCAVCGAPQANTSNTSDTGMTRITVAGQTMSISKKEGKSIASQDASRLRKLKKLSLVLDLDHTLLHATGDPRAQKLLGRNDVRSIALATNQRTAAGRAIMARHFVKLRPGVKTFIENAMSSYEIGVYTAGTREYAEQIVLLLSRVLVGATCDQEDLDKLRDQVGEGKRELDSLNTRKKAKVSFNIPSVPESEQMTSQKLDEMKSKLSEAEDLETKARALRRRLFGNRIISRTDVNDLGPNVKSLQRAFPCGGDMAVVVDDREDVWANSADIAVKRRGEPPENLLLVRPYHWAPFQGCADVNNKAGVDLAKVFAGPTDTTFEDNSDKDIQLKWIGGILSRLHDRFFASQEESTSVGDVLQDMRKMVLSGAKVVLSGVVPLHQQSEDYEGPRPAFRRYAESLGAAVVAEVKPDITHIIAAKDHTEKVDMARRTNDLTCFIVKPSWIMESFWSLSRAIEVHHLLGKPNNMIGTRVEKQSTSDSDDDDFAAELESALMT